MSVEVGDELDPRDVERAKTFWAKEDMDQIFTWVFSYLDHLKRVLQISTATDQEYVQALNLLEALSYTSSVSPQDQESSVVRVVIGSGELLPAEFSTQSPASSSPAASPVPPLKGSSSSAAPPAGIEDLLPPLVPVQLHYRPHTCCKACMPSLPSMLRSTPLFWGQNPLKVPLLCGFKRLSAMPLPTDEAGEEAADWSSWDVVYKAPCGQSLRSFEDVMRFLLASESCDVLQVDFFTFNPSVQLDPPAALVPRHPEQDLSRGLEPTPVELCVGDGGARPADFRYRKDRWPHGCFLSRDPMLFRTCCDCSDGCSGCACAAMTAGGRGYSYHRLLEPVPSGLYECGPWCGCDRSVCQNRLVQRGIRVRLQVFQTEDRGWGVRCRDDLDRGTFVCIYAGVVLQRVQSPTELPPPKLSRADFPSDDEVEVVTEWLAPPVLEGRSDLLETPLSVSTPTSPPLHVPVIQRPADSAATPQDRDKTPTMAALLLLLLGLSAASACREQIPPHDQVARVARFIAHQCDWASMATISTHKPVVGQPFSNAFSVSDGPHGTSSGVPYMYLTRMEISVKDLEVNPQASLSMSLAQTDYCRQQGFDPQSPLCAHIILSGSVLEVNGTEADFAKKALFSRHPEMIDWPTDHDWFFAKFNITQVWVLDYFGGVKTVTPEEYFQAPPHRKHH